MHLDITFGLQVVESSSLVSVLLEKCLTIPTSPFFHLLVNGFSVTCFRTFFRDTFFGSIGVRGGNKMASASTPSVNEPTRASF